MAGPKLNCTYTLDDGTTQYALKVPTWATSVVGHSGTPVAQTCTAPGSLPPLPKGLITRKRFAKITATGHEVKFTVLSPSEAVYTANFGTPVEVELFNTTPPTADNATLQGAVGERRLNR